MTKIKNILYLINLQNILWAVFKALMIGLCCISIGNIFFKNPSLTLIYSAVISLFLFVFFVRIKPKRPSLVKLLHQKNPHLENSTNIFFKTNLTIAEQMQLDRLQIDNLKTPLIIDKNSSIYLLGFLICFGLNFLLKSNTKSNLEQNLMGFKSNPVYTNKQVQLTNAEVIIKPPAYTLLPSKASSDLNIQAIMGSTLLWKVSLSNYEDSRVILENNQKQHLSFVNSKGVFELSEQLMGSGLYCIKVLKSDSIVYQSEYYKIDAIADNPPIIRPSSKEFYTYHYLKDPKTINVSANISDDFLVTKAYLVATLARGSGENVKFRELQIEIDATNFKQKNINKVLNLTTMNFSPGDELYYYWAAFDNKTPSPNFTKSDTYFVVYKDTTAVDETDLATMAMNIMPEYFRSQRQIIIDTEKLLKSKKNLTQQAFNTQSNEIGFDQKVLRLKYGQYLGEEFEGNIGANHDDEHDDENILSGFEHKHDEGEHEDDHSTKHEHETSKTKETNPVAELLAEYVHAHDDGEMNTFYEQSTRSLLKSALEQMWQSELYLRTYQPNLALPYENKALEFLKKAQQSARVYVKKSGFEMTPIKVNEKRLTGELTKFNKVQTFSKQINQVETQKLASEIIGFLDLAKLSAIQKQKILKFSVLLSSAQTNDGVGHITNIRYFQKLLNDTALSKDEKYLLKSRLMKFIGFEPTNFFKKENYLNQNKLEKAFYKAL